MYRQSYARLMVSVHKMKHTERDLVHAAAMNTVAGICVDFPSHRMIAYWEQTVNGNGII